MNIKIKRLEGILVMMTTYCTDLMSLVPAHMLDELPDYFKSYHIMLAENIILTCEALIELYNIERTQTLDNDLKDLIDSKIEEVQEVIKAANFAKLMRKT